MRDGFGVTVRFLFVLKNIHDSNPRNKPKQFHEFLEKNNIRSRNIAQMLNDGDKRKLFKNATK